MQIYDVGAFFRLTFVSKSYRPQGRSAHELAIIASKTDILAADKFYVFVKYVHGSASFFRMTCYTEIYII